MLDRRHCLLGLAASLAGTLSGCASPTSASSSASSSQALLDARTGQPLTPEALRERLRASDAVLLGELHDNAQHHARRAELIAELPAPLTVVMEHLPRGARPELPPELAGDALLGVLEPAGFEAKAWGWPLHRPLFEAAARRGQRIEGGNLPRDQVRAIAREGAAAAPDELRTLIERNPLGDAARQALEQDLLRGHCGHLSAARLPGMVWAQRARDAAMAQTMAEAMDRVRDGSRRAPVLLLAGNGHVRRDYGVPQLLAALRPQARLLSIGFSEYNAAQTADTVRPYDVLWRTEPSPRGDPCAGMSLPKPPAPPTTR